MDEIQRRQCGRKLTYSTKQQAQEAAKAMHKRYHAKFRAYPCVWGCNGYHVGTVRSVNQAIRRQERRGL